MNPSARVASLGTATPSSSTGRGADPGCVAPAAANVSAVAKLEAEHLLTRSLGERAADFIARVAGSGWCLVAHAVWFTVWIVVNLNVVTGIPVFDPYPFQALTTAVSLEAIFLTLFVLISQNRMTRQADRRAHLDLQVNLLAEQEGTATLRLLRRLCERFDIPPEPAADDRELERATDLQRLASEVDRSMPTQ